LDHEFESWKIRVVSAYRVLYSRNQRDGDGSPAPYDQNDYVDHQHQWSEEIDVSGKALNRRLRWTLGAYYFREQADSIYRLSIAGGLYQALERLPGAVIPLGAFGCPGGPACAGGAGNPLNIAFDLDLSDRLHARSRSSALFGDVEWEFRPHFSAYAGLRCTVDAKGYTVSIARQQSHTFLVDPTAPPNKSWNNWSPQLGLKWQGTEHIMAYASVAEGYKAGGFNPRPGDDTAARTPFDPEQLWAVELGVKTDLLGQRLRWNTSLFDYDYRRLQLLAAAVVNGATVPSEVIKNVGRARLRGAETELMTAATDALSLQASIGYLDAHYRDSAFAITGISASTPLQKAPKWSATAAAEYALHASAGTLVLRADCAYVGTNFPDVRATATLEQHAHALVNGRVAWTGAGDRWMVALYARNLFDKHYTQNGFDARQTQDSIIVIPSPPRELGLQLKKEF